MESLNVEKLNQHAKVKRMRSKTKWEVKHQQQQKKQHKRNHI